jgi:hypothetical protein
MLVGGLGARRLIGSGRSRYREDGRKFAQDAEVNMRALKFGLIIAAAAIVLTACATQPMPSVPNPPGFLLGFVHGFISLFSLIGGIFWDIRIYAFPNSGGWYDFGFVLGAMAFYGGGGGGGASRYR